MSKLNSRNFTRIPLRPDVRHIYTAQHHDLELQTLTMEIIYFTLPELPDKPMFRCERRTASLQTANCAKMWNEANRSKNSKVISPCKNCPVGAKHAGINNASQSPITGSRMCARCDRVGMRMVGDHLCVSCWNREREYLIGRDRRGSKPKSHPILHRMQLSYLSDGEVKTIKQERASSMKELIIACIRDSKHSVILGCVRGMNAPE